MTQFKIGTRLLLGFASVVMLIIGFAIFAAVELRTIEVETVTLAKTNTAAFEAIAGGAREIPAQLKQQSEASHAKAIASYESALYGLAIGCILALVIAIGFAIAISRSIVQPLGKMIAVMRDIAEGEGDLTKNIYLKNRDELGELSKWFDMFMDNIQDDITQIGQSTQQIAAASAQLHSTAEQIAAGADEVANQSERVAAAGEQMSASAGEIAQSCATAAEGSHHASDAAIAGARVVDETITVMNSIAGRVKETAKSVETLGNRTEQIGVIAGTIQEIADQTNLLALNAAIEAARAGEQGRGFAVVADEVRKLAERTRKATTEISAMIGSIQNETREAVTAMETGVEEVARGSQKAEESGAALARILDQIHAVATQINQVAKAAQEQTQVTQDISQNMHQITGIVARTANGAQETTRAADQLSALAGELNGIVGQFKV
ncbi:methyl-accepting chemotaxis protein [uncultured Propionivibrio sp.]|uniref:methyl-accepting chemotaxis protein n=1 Tax=uncultured Propionivibrio sp. TaxID=426737 RepID=UPI0029C0EBBA|nr:methyl-accepting chemotaxis protein [uncultured Propionivibrio sp.]